MNALISHVRQTLYDITESLLAGPEGLPMRHIDTARAIVNEAVPLSWTHPNMQPSTHTLFSWLDGRFHTP